MFRDDETRIASFTNSCAGAGADQGLLHIGHHYSSGDANLELLTTHDFVFREDVKNIL